MATVPLSSRRLERMFRNFALSAPAVSSLLVSLHDLGNMVTTPLTLEWLSHKRSGNVTKT
jgi:hypothetical protein